MLIQYLHHTFVSAWAEIGPEIADEAAPRALNVNMLHFDLWHDLDPTRDLES